MLLELSRVLLYGSCYPLLAFLNSDQGLWVDTPFHVGCCAFWEMQEHQSMPLLNAMSGPLSPLIS